MVIKRTIDKETVKDLPKAAFPGQIHVVQTPWEAEKAVAYLKSCPLLGIDSETRPSFTKGQIHKVALLQISSEEHCFLFRLNLTGLTLPVITLLENPSVTKVGLSLRDDFMMLHKRAKAPYCISGSFLSKYFFCIPRFVRCRFSARKVTKNERTTIYPSIILNTFAPCIPSFCQMQLPVFGNHTSQTEGVKTLGKGGLQAVCSLTETRGLLKCFCRKDEIL